VIYRSCDLDLPARFKVDVCVVGSGAGGGMAAMALAESGASVLILESGDYVPHTVMNQREAHMFPSLFQDNGSRTNKSKTVKVHQGRGLGGSTLHNLNLCARIPPPVRAEWRRDHGLGHLPTPVWDALYDEVEEMLGVGPVAIERRSRHNRILQAGCEALGWRGGGHRHNRTGCLGSGFCEVGCAYDAKNNSMKVPIPRALAAGAEALVLAQAVRIVFARGRVRGIEAVAIDPVSLEVRGTIEVACDRVVLAASATATAALLRRSNVPDPSETTGRSLRVHPAVVAAGDFDEPVYAWQGIPQSYDCTEHLDFEAAHPADGSPPPDRAGMRTWIVPAFAHPLGTATMMPGMGRAHHSLMERYAHMAVLTAMVHDHTQGTVTPLGDRGLTIQYEPVPADERELLFGLKACAQLLFAAGAKRVFIASDPPRILEKPHELASLSDFDRASGRMDVTAVHPMGSVPMGDDPTTHAVGSDGKHHHLDGLWVADGSLFPTSIGVPPQISIYTMGLHVGRAVARS
jgi:choline dehydrogenase-like flavoprotein